MPIDLYLYFMRESYIYTLKGRRNNNDNKSSHDHKPRGLYSNAIYENIW